MKHLAEAAGVSVMTVSRALKNHPRQSKSTRERIQQLAREMGYRPHPYVAALMSDLSQRRTDSVAVNLAVFHFSSLESTQKHVYYCGVVQRARALGYTPEPFLYDPSQMPLKRLRSILVARGIRGIILMPAPEGFTSLEFDFDGFAVAALGHTVIHPPMPRVASDIYALMFQALDELTRRGYRRIGLVTTDYVSRLGRFLHSAGMRVYRSFVEPNHHLVELLFDDLSDTPRVRRRLVDWVRREKLEVLVCPTFDQTVYQILQQEGIRIPEDLAYVHLIDHPDPNVTSLSQMAEFVGGTAVDLVVAMINRNEFGLPPFPQTVATPHRWQEGRTAPDRKLPIPD